MCNSESNWTSMNHLRLNSSSQGWFNFSIMQLKLIEGVQRQGWSRQWIPTRSSLQGFDKEGLSHEWRFILFRTLVSAILIIMHLFPTLSTVIFYLHVISQTSFDLCVLLVVVMDWSWISIVLALIVVETWLQIFEHQVLIELPHNYLCSYMSKPLIF